ncbi:sensor histidine kinase KdpD [Pseudomonas stutzeri]|uniref:sensor histidine kinase n=1 Tax=Stutzerimonas stutzeri TaxID=316 RepID=UPI000C9ADC45|nr:sensor histidine kinase KdpD [Stutzerimonas stutzeri]MCQ4279150.1 sensor histidine kinase KdpD [Stutzerimonas stutzeri]PNF73942.1 histidine kinase [Stutzerimonas stutzeri]
MSDAQRADALLDDAPREGRGRLKVFLGAAPGVGKTYAMLQAAQRQRQLERDVRVGVVETHGRAETEAMRVGMAEQPMRRSEYRGVTLFEMDLDGLLQLRPSLALVDELAHSNAPGSRHAKRWQDVLELLEAGIDVYTTVNVQHLESLNDQVRGITGVQVRETVPDWVLHQADDILLIDLPPRELLERLREGKVYVPEQARAAIDAFFTQTNLTALRELAMQTAAARVDADLHRRHRLQGQTAPAVRGRLLVGIDGDAYAEGLVRHAARVAERRHLPWSVVHVDTGASRGEVQLGYLQSAQQLAERLGGEVVELRDERVARTLIEHAVERRATLVLVGGGRVRRVWKFSMRRSIAEQLIKGGRGLEISVLGQEPALAAAPVRTTATLDWRQYLLAALATLTATGVALMLSRYLALPNISLVFLAAVLVVAVRSSLGPALACAGLSFVLYDFLFIPPTFTFIVARQEDVLTLMFFLLMAVLAGNLASRQRRQLQALRQTQAQTTALLDLSRQLSAATDVQAVGAAAVRQLQLVANLEAVIATRGKQGKWMFIGAEPLLAEPERGAAEWAFKHGQPAGKGTDTLPSGQWWWLPLSGDGQPLGLLGIRQLGADTAGLQKRRLIAALAQPLAQALGRATLAQELEAARLHGQTEELRSALLASVSHDLRTPLTAMRGSIDSLASLGHSMSEADRQELLEATRDEAERLDRYIQNLLDMTRLGHGGLKLIRDWTTPADIIASALQRLHRVLADLRLELLVPDDLPLLYVHPALVEQALVNVLENAARFSPPQGRLQIAVSTGAGTLRFIVSDEGPGVPEAERERIFDMFYTAARGDRGGPGTGLGLAICQGMIGAHGGRVFVADGLGGRGASVTLELPLQPQPEMEKDLT